MSTFSFPSLPPSPLPTFIKSFIIKSIAARLRLGNRYMYI